MNHAKSVLLAVLMAVFMLVGVAATPAPTALPDQGADRFAEARKLNIKAPPGMPEIVLGKGAPEHITVGRPIQHHDGTTNHVKTVEDARAYHLGPGNPFRHAGCFRWGGGCMDAIPYIWIYDRTTEADASAALKSYITAMQNVSAVWGGKGVYPLYYDDRVNGGNCGPMNDYVRGVEGYSLMLACSTNFSGSLAGLSIVAHETYTGHLLGGGWARIDTGRVQGVDYSLWCHELGHNFAYGAGGVDGSGHSSEGTASCMHNGSISQWEGYSNVDLAEMFQLYNHVN